MSEMRLLSNRLQNYYNIVICARKCNFKMTKVMFFHKKVQKYLWE